MNDRQVYKATNSRRRYKIVNPFRFFIFILVCIMITIFASYGIFGPSKVSAAVKTEYAEVKVQENDTLWNIIETYNPNANIDIRMALYDVYEINNISADSIRPGDVILVPIY